MKSLGILRYRGVRPGKAVKTKRQLENRGTQREYSSKPLKHSIVERILVFKR